MTDPGARLDAYEELIRAWADRLDLVSPSDLARVRSRHIDDSLRALPLVRAAPSGPGIDVGSGAGLPGIPLAIVAPERPWRLLEPRSRRAAFLEEVIRALDLDCEVSRMTAEAAAGRTGWAGAHAVATARALAAPARAFDLLMPLVAPGGRAIVFAGPGAEIPAETRVHEPGLLYREGSTG